MLGRAALGKASLISTEWAKEVYLFDRKSHFGKNSGSKIFSTNCLFDKSFWDGFCSGLIFYSVRYGSSFSIRHWLIPPQTSKCITNTAQVHITAQLRTNVSLWIRSLESSRTARAVTTLMSNITVPWGINTFWYFYVSSHSYSRNKANRRTKYYYYSKVSRTPIP